MLAYLSLTSCGFWTQQHEKMNDISLSYYRQQEAQLPQRNSASAAHMERGLGPPAHSPAAPSGYT